MGWRNHVGVSPSDRNLWSFCRDDKIFEEGVGSQEGHGSLERSQVSWLLRYDRHSSRDNSWPRSLPYSSRLALESHAFRSLELWYLRKRSDHGRGLLQTGSAEEEFGRIQI